MPQGTVLINNMHSHVLWMLNLAHIFHEKLPCSASKNPSPSIVTSLKSTITATWTSTGAWVTEGNILLLSLSLVIEELKMEDTVEVNKRIELISHILALQRRQGNSREVVRLGIILTKGKVPLEQVTSERRFWVTRGRNYRNVNN